MELIINYIIQPHNNILILHTGNEQYCVIVSYQASWYIFVADLMCESLSLDAA